jgi:cobalt-precorrin 5A hydrolase
MQKHQNIGIIAITLQGNELALKISEELANTSCYTLAKWNDNRFIALPSKLSEYCSTLFEKHDALIFIMATGIVVRSIASCIQNKVNDPAVLVIDDRGNHVISLLSGHLGGANSLTIEVAKFINANPVITTASDVNNLPSVDMLAQEFGLKIASMHDAKVITAMLVNGQNIALDDSEDCIPKDRIPRSQQKVEGKLVVSHKKHLTETVPFVQLIPQNTILGIGCKRNTEPQKLIDFIKQKCDELNIHPKSIAKIVSIDVKADEKAILDAASHLNCSLQFYPAEQLAEVDHLFEGSEFVKQQVGVASVSTSAAFIAANKKGDFILKKCKKDGMTLSILLKTNKEND